MKRVNRDLVGQRFGRLLVLEQGEDVYIGKSKTRRRTWFIYGGRYVDYNDAVKARKKLEDKYFGEYNYDNSINTNELEEE